jgi:hypothetical protein
MKQIKNIKVDKDVHYKLKLFTVQNGLKSINNSLEVLLKRGGFL